LLDFADAWTAYEGALHDAALRFRPFDSWSGKAVTQVEAQFQRHRDWLNQMATSSRTLGQQARDLAFAHYAAASQHPRSAQVEPLYAKLSAKRISSRDYAAYLKMQKQSEEVRTEYRKKAGLPLSPLNLLMPPERADSDLLMTPEEKAQEQARKAQEERLKTQQEAYKPMQELLKQQQEQARIAQEEARKARQEALDDARKAREEARIAQQEAQDEAHERAQEAQDAMQENLAKSLNSQQALAKSMGKAGMPTLPSPSKLMGAAGQFANMAKGMGPKPVSAGGNPGGPLVPPLPVGGNPPHVNPASHGAAGAALGGGVGIPPSVGGANTPPRLQPPSQSQPSLHSPKVQIPVDPEALLRPAAAPGHPGATPGTAPAGGGTGGSGMGGLGAGQGQGGAKAKRVQPDDPAVYTEERAWTEGVIGLRPRRAEPAPPPPPPDGAN
jgi:chemotaxis protein histidine kinase CheA